jgi:hypothetical protein
MDKKFYKTVDYLLILLGVFLILDSFYLHYIQFDYNTIGLGRIDQWFHHWMIGAVLVAVGVWDLKKS